jgi:hypothetical protein
LQKEISAGRCFAQFGAMQQTEQPNARVGGQIIGGLQYEAASRVSH